MLIQCSLIGILSIAIGKQGKLPDDALLFGDVDSNPPSPNAFGAAF
jgi:hypothetical protein